MGLDLSKPCAPAQSHDSSPFRRRLCISLSSCAKSSQRETSRRKFKGSHGARCLLYSSVSRRIVDAVTLVDGKPTVFVVVEPNVVRAISVALGASDGRQADVARGLQPGESVVTVVSSRSRAICCVEREMDCKQMLQFKATRMAQRCGRREPALLTHGALKWGARTGAS